MTILALAVAIVALLRVIRLEREIKTLRTRLDARPGAPPMPQSATAPAASTIPAPRAFQAAPSAAAVASPSSPTVSPIVPAVPIHDGNPEEIERRIGERLLLYAGMVVLLLGIAFFLRYAFDREWMSPAVRVLIGLSGGLTLVAGGRWLAGAGYRQYGLFLTGGGLAVLFLSVYSAYGFYALIGPALAFASLAAIAVATAILADRESALALALMAVIGGFATPFLVGGGGDAQLVLFSYVAVLTGATMFLAHRRGWPALNVVTFVLTLFTVVAWADAYYTDAKYLRTELFITLYCAMFVWILRETLRSSHRSARLVAGILCAAPVLYHAASVAILSPHDAALLVYLLAVSVAIVVASIEAELSPLRLAGWVAVIVPLMYFVPHYREEGWRSSAIVTSVGVWGIFLAGQLRLVRRGERLNGWDVALLHASGIGAFAAIYVGLVDAVSPRFLAWIAASLAGANVIVWYLQRRHASALNWMGLGFTLAASAIAVGFQGHWIVVMWAAEATVLMWVGVRADRDPFRIAGLVLFAIAGWKWIQSPSPDRTAAFFVLLHARALAGMCLIALLYAAGWLMRRPAASDGARGRIERAAVLVAANVATVALVSLEIGSYWVRQTRAIDANLAMQLMLSASWAAYAAAVVIVGMRRHYAPVRYFAIVLFAITLLKVFAVDVQQLEGVYRIVAFVVVGGILLLVSFLYQRSR